MMESDKIFGSLLGLVLADAIGAIFEGLPPEQLRATYQDKYAAFDDSACRDSLRYTDDGQMALALAEYLTENDTIESNSLMTRFVAAYESWRGYGHGTRVLIEAFRDQADYEFMAQHHFPGGSLGNGAAMRSAPVGLRFAGKDRIWEEAKRSAWPTHRHELGIEGGQIIALATYFAATSETINPLLLANSMTDCCKTTVFQNRLARLSQLKHEADIETFGNGIEAHESVVTALACFSMFPNDFRAAVSTAIWQGGDTDTVAAMTGALVGARAGSSFASEISTDALEDGAPFLKYLQDLSIRLEGSD